MADDLKDEQKNPDGILKQVSGQYEYESLAIIPT